jgi:hypothetical protein
MPKEKTLLSQKSIAIIAIAVVFTVVMTIVIAANSDFPIASYIPLLKKKAPAAQNQSQSTSPFKVLFAKNGDTEIYKVQKDDKWVVVIDGQESAAYDDVANPTFSEDGSQFAYSAELDGEEFVIMNNEQQGGSYFNIIQILFNPDGSILAFLADTGSGKLVVVNGVEGVLYDNITTMETEFGTTYLVFSEDGTQIAYYAQNGNNLLTIINGQVTAVQPIVPATPTGNSTTPTPPPAIPNDPATPTTTAGTKLNAKDKARNLNPDIDKQPDKLNPLICGQTTDCNF